MILVLNIIYISLVSHVKCTFEESSADPCLNFTDIGNPARSIEYDMPDDALPLCDLHHISTGNWYRFIQHTGEMMPESCVPLRKCGTLSPIWMNGSHPTATGETKQAMACGNFEVDGSCCEWTEPIKVKKCEQNASNYFVYQLTTPNSCPSSYCAGDVNVCPEGHFWDPLLMLCRKLKESTEVPKQSTLRASSQQGSVPSVTTSTTDRPLTTKSGHGMNESFSVWTIVGIIIGCIAFGCVLTLTVIGLIYINKRTARIRSEGEQFPPPYHAHPSDDYCHVYHNESVDMYQVQAGMKG